MKQVASVWLLDDLGVRQQGVNVDPLGGLRSMTFNGERFAPCIIRPFIRQWDGIRHKSYPRAAQDRLHNLLAHDVYDRVAVFVGGTHGEEITSRDTELGNIIR